MDDFEYRVLLYDFYGQLLTPDQREVYDEHVMEDLTVSEIAQNRGVSRQAVSDLIKRTEKILALYEEKLGLVGRFINIRKRIGDIRALAVKNGQSEIAGMIEGILEEL